MVEPSQSLAARLRELYATLSKRGVSGWPGAPEICDRLRRDLLPRTAGADDHLVVGIVGPNNAGKSALFNALVAGVDEPGAPAPPTLSPSIATGGATRRLVGAIGSELRAALEAEPTLQRFRMRGVTPGPAGVDVATEAADADEVSELLLIETDSLPGSLLLVDTPDFDSVLRENRDVTDALLAVADVAVTVVTRHTYQNHDVIEFLNHWLAHGRPWVLVYNESIDAETTRSHAEKVASDLGGPPEAVFHSPFDPGVARGTSALVPVHVDDPPGGALASWLRSIDARSDLKARALEASLAGLREDLRDLAADARSSTAAIEAILAASRRRALPLGRAVAREAMPMGPFLEAFRDVLDERPSAVQRELRRTLRWTGDRVVGGARRVRTWLSGNDAQPSNEEAPARTLLDAERHELAARWTPFYEPGLLELRRAERDPGTPAAAVAVLADLTGSAASASTGLERANAALALDPALLDEHRHACREILRAELDERGTEWLLQIAVDAMHLLPLGVAGALIVHTGGLGADVAMAGGGAAAAAAAERLSRTLGAGVAQSARQRWTEIRSAKIADAALEGLYGDADDRLQALADEGRSIAEIAASWTPTHVLTDQPAAAADPARSER